MSANPFLHCQQQHATALLICADVMLAVLCVNTNQHQHCFNTNQHQHCCAVITLKDQISEHTPTASLWGAVDTSRCTSLPGSLTPFGPSMPAPDADWSFGRRAHEPACMESCRTPTHLLNHSLDSTASKYELEADIPTPNICRVWHVMHVLVSTSTSHPSSCCYGQGLEYYGAVSICSHFHINELIVACISCILAFHWAVKCLLLCRDLVQYSAHLQARFCRL